MQWHTQAGNITTNIKVKVYFTLPKLSATKMVTWNCHEDESDKDTYSMILGRYLSEYLVFNLKLSENIINSDVGTLKGSTAPLVDLGTYKFNF